MGQDLLPMLVCIKFQGESIEEKDAPQYVKHLGFMIIFFLNLVE